MNAEPLDELDENELVRMARYVAKGVILAGEQGEEIFMADLLELIAKRNLDLIGKTKGNLEAQKN